MTIWPKWPKWPHIDIWLNNIGRGSQADAHVWVLLSCYVTWKSTSIFNINELLTPVTQNDPRLTFNLIALVEGLKLMHMYETDGHAIQHGCVKVYLVKITFWPSDPKWPQIDIRAHNIGRGSQADSHVWVLCSCYVTWTS